MISLNGTNKLYIHEASSETYNNVLNKHINGDYFETFTPSGENPAGTADRVAEFTRATGKGAEDRLSLGDMGNIMDIQYK